METTRQQKKKKIARPLQKNWVKYFYSMPKMQGTLITVTGVRISPDLSVARAHLSIFQPIKVKSVLEQVNADTKSIRFDLGKRVRHQLRIIPELYFSLTTAWIIWKILTTCWNRTKRRINTGNGKINHINQGVEISGMGGCDIFFSKKSQIPSTWYQEFRQPVLLWAPWRSFVWCLFSMGLKLW